MSLGLILCAMLLSAGSGVPGLFLSRHDPRGQRIAAAFMALAMLVGLAGAFAAMIWPLDLHGYFPWPALGDSLVGLDALSAFFLVPVLLVGGLGSIYGLAYWPQKRHPDNGRKLAFFWGWLVAGMSLLVIARQAFAFLLGWELMALSAFFLVTTEDKKAESRRAGFIYIIATHIGTLTLFGLFTLWRQVSASYDLVPMLSGQNIDFLALNALFLLALLGFGLKAGLMPLHFWLPGAHANAPTHVSAMLSGVVLKMGIYGLLRFLWLLPDPPLVWGVLILILACISGVLGVAFALAQHDLKRLLAYHSVENIGIILMGLGLAMVGRSTANTSLVVLGLAGCLLHVWNHSLFKSLLFFAAGSVIHGAHSRRIEQLGGLARRMPFTALFFLIGAAAICGLPPLNGFVSELFVYLGFFGAIIGDQSRGLAIALGAPVLALVGALALACFVKVYGVVFLGEARTAAAARSQEARWPMHVAMGVLALSCLLIGILPILISPLLDAAITLWRGGAPFPFMPVANVSPIALVSLFSPLLAGAAGGLLFGMWLYRRRKTAVMTWDCGYARPGPRMQYTASSFARSILAFFSWVLHPVEHRPRVEGAFPKPSAASTHVDDTVLDRVLLPLGRRAERWSAWFRRFQQGLTQYYVAYILFALMVMLCTLVPIGDILARLMAR